MTIRVNITSRVNQDMISEREQNGRKQIVIRSVVARDDTVLNGILYPAAELDKALPTLNEALAPFGHPVDEDGMFLPAGTPLALNGFYFGAYNENPRREGNRLVTDKVIDVARARESDMGRRVLDAINAGGPIHTSTGLYCELDRNQETNQDIARNIVFDHDAILLDEPGAITPEQGVGMMVNKKAIGQDRQPVEAVYNSVIEDVEEDIDEAGLALVEAIARRETASLWVRMKAALGVMPTRDVETSEVQNMSDSVTKEQFDALSAKVDGLADAVTGKLTEAVQNAVKPLNDKVDGIVAAQNADAEAKKADLVKQVVNKQLLPEDVAKATPVAALEAMLKNAAGDDDAANLMNGYNGKSGKTAYELPKE